jgi:succinyl-CoA synthetase beta subunit
LCHFIKLNATSAAWSMGRARHGPRDILELCGGKPLIFWISWWASAEKVAAALKIILNDKDVKSILINIFGGITRCDEVAKGVLMAAADLKIQIPIVVRLVGTNQVEGQQLLQEKNYPTAGSLLQAAKMAVQLAGEKQS